MRLDPHTFGREQPCFGCSPEHPIGFHLEFDREGDTVQTRLVPSAHHQGPPGILHGGLVTTLADELAAWTIVALKGQLGFTAAIDARFHRPVRIGREVLGTGTILEDGGRVVKVEVVLEQEGTRTYRGLFTFAVLDRRGAERLLEAELPEAWARFCR
jgi:uncharacterized protein (TIGR00369 family)